MFPQQILQWPSREHGWFHGWNLDQAGASSHTKVMPMGESTRKAY